MTAAHVPPQCAGNSMITPEYKLMVKEGVVSVGRNKLGGIHFLGHCADCNSRIGERYDQAYGDFAALMRAAWVKDWRISCPPIIEVSGGNFYPGRVIRSIVLGMCAVEPSIYTKHPAFVEGLMDGSAVEFPGDTRLFLALARGMSARVNGVVGGIYTMGPKRRYADDRTPIGILSTASVYFPPLAWELANSEKSFLPDDGWADVSEWAKLSPGEQHDVSEYFTRLPVVAHPQHSPDSHEDWTVRGTHSMVQSLCGLGLVGRGPL